MRKLYSLIVLFQIFYFHSQNDAKPQLKIFIEKKFSLGDSLWSFYYDSLSIKSKYERIYDISVFYRSDKEFRIEEFKKRGIKIKRLESTYFFQREIVKGNFRKEFSFNFSKTKFNALNDSLFEEEVENINDIFKEAKSNSRKNKSLNELIFYFPIEHIDLQLKKVPGEVKKTPFLEFEIELNSVKPVYINWWFENFDGDNWIENEKNKTLLNPGINFWSNEISNDSIRVHFEFQKDIDSTCISSVSTNVIRYKFKNEVKPICPQEKSELKFFYYELDEEEVKCGAEKLILRNGYTDNYEFLIPKQAGVSKYIAVFEDLCDSKAKQVELEMKIDESYIDDKYIVLYIPIETLYKYDLFERILDNNVYAKELLMTLKLVVNAQKAFIIPNTIFCKEKIAWQKCNN